MKALASTRLSRRKLNGYLTVFLSLSLSIILSLFFVLIRVSYVNYSKMKLEIVTDIGLNAVLGEYHRELLYQYDLLFIDLSYGTSIGEVHNLRNHLIGYIDKNLEPEKNSVSDWNELTLHDVRITETLMAHHYDGKILKRQACAYISDNIRAEAINDLTSLLTGVKSLDAADEMASWQNVMGSISKILASLTKEARQKALAENPEADIEKINITINNPADKLFENKDRHIEVLFPSDVKGTRINLNNYYSHRSKNENNSQIGGNEAGFLDSLSTMVLFNTYIFEKLGYHNSLKDNSLLDYQVEYLIVGADSDEKNLKGIRNRIFAWRFADNARLYFTDSQKRNEANMIAATVSTLLMNPQLTQLIAYSLLFSWAFSDSLDDVQKLLNDEKVPLIKKSIGSDVGGLSYKQYLELMLLIARENTITARVMDIIEMDIRLTPYNQNFRIDMCLESFRISATYIDRFEVYTIDRRYGY